MNLTLILEWRVMSFAVEQVDLVTIYPRVDNSFVGCMIFLAFNNEAIAREIVAILRKKLLFLLRDEKNYKRTVSRRNRTA
jgi:hypothetical protein